MPKDDFQSTREAQAAMVEPVNLNSAGREELRAVKGIGDARADQIMEWRQRNGRFASVDDLQQLSLFPAEVLAEIRRHLTV